MSDKEQQEKGTQSLFLGSKKALVGGFLAGSIALTGQWLVGQIYSGYEARQLLEGVASAALYMGGAAVTASATIIALMLTMISLTRRSEGEFDSLFFKRIERIGSLSSIAMISGILLLFFLTIPLQESDKVPAEYFTILYYILIVFLAILAGLLVSIVLMLTNAISSLIDVVKPEMDEEVEAAKEKEDNAK